MMLMNLQSGRHQVGLLPMRWLDRDGSEEPLLCRGGRWDEVEFVDRRHLDDEMEVSGLEWPDLPGT